MARPPDEVHHVGEPVAVVIAASPSAADDAAALIVPDIESSISAPFEMARLEIGTDGSTCIYAGTQNHGQGHESAYAQVVSDLLGIPFEKISLARGDTVELAIGGGTHSDRPMRMMGTLLRKISADIVAQALPLAAKLLQAPEAAVAFSDENFHGNGADDGRQEVSILDVAAALSEFPEFQYSATAGLVASADHKGRINAFSYGAAAAEVEIDPETGEMTLCNFCIVNDSGVAVNPMIVHARCMAALFRASASRWAKTSFTIPLLDRYRRARSWIT
jgi:carbon-monoxide dehydrogenase large subunit